MDKKGSVRQNRQEIQGIVGSKKFLESPNKKRSKQRKNLSCSPKIRTFFDQQTLQENPLQNSSTTLNTIVEKPSKKSLKSHKRVSKENSTPFQQQNIQLQQQQLGLHISATNFHVQENKSKSLQKKKQTERASQVGPSSQVLDIIKEKKVKKSNNSAQKENQELQPQKPKKKKAQKLKLTQLKDLKPLNLEQEKQIFFEKHYQYNPIFLYSTSDILFSIQNPHTKHMSLAVKILSALNDQYQNEENWNDQEGGVLLTKEETDAYFKQYIEDLGISEMITYEFSENTISPTSCVHNNVEGTSKVIIGLPIVYRKNRIMGVLNHEIGTHFLRKFNDKLQKWRKQRKKLDLQNYSKIEEGLACINQHFELSLDQTKQPLLYRAALLYYASVQASSMSFQDLYRDLEQYIKNVNDRWKICVRVKRGISKTEEKAGQYKDQIYLRGAIKVLQARNQLNFNHLHCGKISVKDCLKFSDKNQVTMEKTILPYFLKDIGLYRNALDRIAQVNFIS